MKPFFTKHRGWFELALLVAFIAALSWAGVSNCRQRDISASRQAAIDELEATTDASEFITFEMDSGSDALLLALEPPMSGALSDEGRSSINLPRAAGTWKAVMSIRFTDNVFVCKPNEDCEPFLSIADW